MRIAILAALLAASPAMSAELVARSGSDVARITEEPCPLVVLKLIPQGSRGHFRVAYMTLDGKEHVACWALRSDHQVAIVYSDGDSTLIPASMFKAEPGV